VRRVLLATLLMAIPSAALAQAPADAGGVVVSTGPESGQKLYSDSWAVLIGADRYAHWPETAFAGPSLEEMRRVLVEEKGFPATQVKMLKDKEAGLQQIRDLLGGELPFVLGTDARLFIYWAGHTTGVDLPGGGRLSFLVPSDGAREVRRIFSTCLSVRELKTLTEILPARHILILVDGSLEGEEGDGTPSGSVSLEGWIAGNASAQGRQLLISASPGETLVEGDGPAVSALVSTVSKGLVSGDADGNRDGVISSSELAAYVSPGVFEKTSKRQTPRLRYLGPGHGEFMFVSPESASLAAPPPPPPPPVAMGHLQINVSAPGSKVFVGGVYRGEASPGVPLNLQNVGLGPVELRVEAAGFEPIVQPVTLASNQWAQAVVGQPKVGATTPKSSRLPAGPGSVLPAISAAPPAPGIPTTDIVPETGPAQMSRQQGPPPETLREGMVEIPAGEFKMGSEDGGRNEKPVNIVKLGSYWLDSREVTVGEFTKYDSEYKPSRFSGCDTCPATNLSWEDAVAYCASLGKRLPTEAEWEKACRGPQELNYPYGDREDESMAHFADEWNAGAVSVGTYPANGYGLHDMSGNAWEWVYDWYDEEYYSRSPGENPTGPRSGRRKAMRGGSWYGSSTLRCWERNKMSPDKHSRNLGFRCAW